MNTNNYFNNLEECCHNLVMQIKKDAVKKPWADNCDLNQYTIDAVKKTMGKDFIFDSESESQAQFINDLQNLAIYSQPDAVFVPSWT